MSRRSSSALGLEHADSDAEGGAFTRRFEEGGNTCQVEKGPVFKSRKEQVYMLPIAT